MIFGSFLNVCIVRLPRRESIVRPASHCPSCLKPIRWYDNIPVLSYLILGGKCRFCRCKISLLYPLVEIITACIFALAVAESTSLGAFLKVAAFAMLMIVLIFTDFRDRLLPHSVTIFGIVLGLALSFAIPVTDPLLEWVFGRMGMTLPAPLSSFLGAVSGGVFGAGLLYGVAWLLRRAGNPSKEYLGFGDVMLMFLVGVFWGIPLTYLTILLGSLVGTLVAVVFILFNRKFRNYSWPYGSFLGAAAIYVSLGGQTLLLWYLSWRGFH